MDIPFVRLVACRTNAGKTMDEWAELLEVSKSTIVNWEKGTTQPNAYQLRRISELSNVPLQFIFVPKTSKQI